MEMIPGSIDILLIHKYVSGSMEPAERQTFEQRLATDPQLAEATREFSLIWGTADSYPVADFDANAAFVRFQQKKPQAQSRPRRWILPAAAAASILLLVFAYFLSDRKSTVHDLIAQTQTEETLPDGTKLQLRPGTHMLVPESFSGKTRTVEMLAGEAYFDIASDKSHPFIVRHPWAEVRVTGTEFSISLDETAGTFTLLVTEGEVIFTPSLTDKDVVVPAGKGLVFHSRTRIIERISTLDENAVSWRTGILKFVDCPVEKVIRDLSDHYAVSITLENDEIAACPFTATKPFSAVPVNVILNALATTFDLEIQQVEADYVLVGGQCK